MRLLVVLLVLQVLRVAPRPIKWSSALEDFDNYLKDTLDAEPDEEFDELEADSGNHWELSGKFEGDILLSDRQHKDLLNVVSQEGLARNGLKDSSRRWPKKTLVYKIMTDHFDSDQIQAIKEGMADLEKLSCIKFKPKTKRDSDYVKIQGLRRGCYSKVGYQGNGAQVLNLTPHPSGQGCMRHGTVVHELLHSLGFFHQQSATDRDKYVKINWNNIRRGMQHNFKKYNSLVSSDFGVPYDYDSVMHYSEYAFSRNRKKTIVPLNDDVITLGQREGLSDKDVRKLNRMYKCSGGSVGSDEEGDEDEDYDSEELLHKTNEEHSRTGYKVTEEIKDDAPQEQINTQENEYSSSPIFDFSNWFSWK